MLAVAVHVVAALAVGYEQTELVVKVMLQITAGLNTPDVGVNVKRRVNVGGIIGRVDPEVMIAFPADNLTENIVNHVSGLFDCRRR